MRKVTSREYKVMLRHRWFSDRRDSVDAFMEEVGGLAQTTSLSISNSLGKPEKREISFFDTEQNLLRRSGLVFRRRIESDGNMQLTIKARNEDRYIANGFDLQTSLSDSKRKLEEDIAPRFRSRFSHSTTAELSPSDSPFGKTPQNLGELASVFPVVSHLKSEGRSAPKKIALKKVNSLTAYERVYKGAKLKFDDESATLAVILWTNGWSGRSLVAEFSLRYKDQKEEYSDTVAVSARRFFESVQRLDWCDSGSITKTHYVYGETN